MAGVLVFMILGRGVRKALFLCPFLIVFFLWACPAPPKETPSATVLSPLELHQRLVMGEPLVLIDTDSYLECMDERIPGALCIACDDVDKLVSHLQTFQGKPIVFYSRGLHVQKPCHALEKAKTKGLPNVAVLIGGISAWKMAGYETESPQRVPRFSIPSIQAKTLDNWIQSRREFLILDIRSFVSFQKDGLKNAMNVPLGQLHERYHEIPVNLPILVIDSDGSRSMLAASFLHRKGFENIGRLRGGQAAWETHRRQMMP
ncbi:MAG: hypothetical protein JW950_06120 [Deltaproteobacteria bacterium]|nr:hypothetical protein [Deltaproteobacteria bacterium]